MANKKQNTPARRAPTKRQLSRWQRENRSKRITLLVGSFVVLVVVALVGFGAYAKFVVPPREVAFKVNGKSFDMEHYVKVMRWLSVNGLSLQSATPDAMERNIVDPELLKEAAPDLGLSVTAEEAIERTRESYRSSLPEGEEFDEAKFQTFLSDRAKTYGLSLQELTPFLEQSTLVNKLVDYLGKDLPANTPQVHLLGIEVTDTLTANEVQVKLAEGQDFAEAARTYSIHTASGSNGGDLGWLAKDLLPADFADTVFSLDAGGLTQPVNGKLSESDTGGFWIFKVAEKDESRAVDEALLSALKNKLATQWFADQRAKSQIENMVTNEKRAWALEQVPVQQ